MRVDFEKGEGLLPAIIQDADTKAVLMLGYMNEEALLKTNETKRVTFYSRSKERLWTKGETSGNFLEVRSIQVDCDKDTLLIQAMPSGPVCHLGTDTCWGKKNKKSPGQFLEYLEDIIQQRIDSPQKESYTNKILAKGINKVAQKVGEEAVELIIEAKDDNMSLFHGEAADLVFHLLMLLKAKGSGLQEVVDVLRSRHNK